MSKLREKLDKATPKYKDVEVSLDGELRSKMTELQSRLPGAPADEQPALREEIEALRQEITAGIITLRIRNIASDRWSSAKANHPPRRGNAMDEGKGYNTVAVVKAVAPVSTQLLEDGQVHPIAEDEWADLWEKLSGGDFDRIWKAVLDLNEVEGWGGIAFLKKG